MTVTFWPRGTRFAQGVSHTAYSGNGHKKSEEDDSKPHGTFSNLLETFHNFTFTFETSWSFSHFTTMTALSLDAFQCFRIEALGIYCSLCDEEIKSTHPSAFHHHMKRNHFKDRSIRINNINKFLAAAPSLVTAVSEKLNGYICEDCGKLSLKMSNLKRHTKNGNYNEASLKKCTVNRDAFHKLSYLSDTPLQDPKLDKNQNPIQTKRIGKQSQLYTDIDLEPVPAPPSPPSIPAELKGRWTYCDETRIFLANFKDVAEVPEDDMKFLLEVMARDDLVVISEGLWAISFEKSLTLEHLENNLVTECITNFAFFVRRRKVCTRSKQKERRWQSKTSFGILH